MKNIIYKYIYFFILFLFISIVIISGYSKMNMIRINYQLVSDSTQLKYNECQQLLEDGANINYFNYHKNQSYLDTIIMRYLHIHDPNSPLVTLINTENRNNNPYCDTDAKRSQLLKITKLFLKYGANPNDRTKKGKPVLLLAVQCNDYDLCQVLLHYGANSNTQTFNQSPTTPLIQASFDVDIRIIHLLLQYNANPNKVYLGMTPLIILLPAGNQSIIQFLLDHHADPNVIASDGTALYQANSLLSILKRVASSTQHKREINRANRLETYYKSIINLLKKHGAKNIAFHYNK